MHSDNHLYDELTRSLIEVNKQIDAVKKSAEAHIKALPYPDAVTVYDIKHRDGTYILTDLLVAKANCLNGMACIKASQKKGK